MQNFLDLLDVNNRIRYPNMARYIMSRSAYEFVAEIKMPFLIGKELFHGDMFAQSLRQANATFRFKPSQLATESTEASNKSITRAIYLVSKNDMSVDAEELDISLGRSSANDITIADYAISKRHASFSRRKGGRYFIEDVGSTNGVLVDNIRVPVGRQKELTTQTTINFGRISFRFAHPLELYCRVVMSMRGTFPQREDLMRIARSVDSTDLKIIAKKKADPLQHVSSKNKILHTMFTEFSDKKLTDWLYLSPLV